MKKTTIFAVGIIGHFVTGALMLCLIYLLSRPPMVRSESPTVTIRYYQKMARLQPAAGNGHWQK